MAVPGRLGRLVTAKLNALVRSKSWTPCAALLRPSILEKTSYYSDFPQDVQKYRCLHKSAIKHNNPSYEHDGRTTVTIMNDEHGAPLMVDSYTQNGFRLNNGIQVLGPMVIFPKTVLGWDVSGVQDISPTSLAIFAILEPKPDVLVIGIGDRGAKMPVETIQFLKKKNINMEILATEHACTTFNFLSGERRCVAAVMIPPTKIVWTGFDLANSKLQKKRLYEDDDDKPIRTPPASGSRRGS